MTIQKRTKSGDMPGLEGMGPVRTGVLIVVVTVLAIVAISAMVKGMDTAHGGVVAAAPQR